jgi:hypothetical protein
MNAEAEILEQLTGQRKTTASKLLWSKKEAASMLSISLRSLDYMIAREQCAIRKLGGRILSPHAELLRIARADHPEPMRPPNDPGLQ